MRSGLLAERIVLFFSIEAGVVPGSERILIWRESFTPPNWRVRGKYRDALALMSSELQIPIERVIDIGCGAGVTTRIFSQAGLGSLRGTSASLIEHARKAAPKAEFIQASACDVVLPDCTAIVAVGEALTYHDKPSAAD